MTYIAQLPAAAEYGLGATTLYLLPTLLFLIPVAPVAAELAMVRSGGVFDWVTAGLGEQRGLRRRGGAPRLLGGDAG